MSEVAPELELDDGGTPFPPYVVSADDRKRWNLCLSIARQHSEMFEPGGVADPQYVWFTTRALYKSDIPT